MIPPTYKPKKKFMQLAIAEAKRARDRGDYPIGAVITRLIGKQEVVIASAGFRFVFHPRTVCDVRRRLRLVEGRSCGVWGFPGRHNRLRQETWDRGIQMARLSDFVQI